MRLLVVDDEPDVRRLLEIQLGLMAEFDVVATAVDGEDALEKCRELRPDAVVMDLLMPGMNGFDAIGRLAEEFPELAVVAYTGVAGDFVRDDMARRHVEVVLKSGDAAALTEAIRQAVDRKRRA